MAYSARGARRGAESRSEGGQGFPNRTGKGALNQLGLDDPRKVTLVAGVGTQHVALGGRRLPDRAGVSLGLF